MRRGAKHTAPAWAVSRKLGEGYRVDIVWRRSAAPARGMVAVGLKRGAVTLRPVQAGGYTVHKYGQTGKLCYVRVGLPTAIAEKFGYDGTACEFNRVEQGQGEIIFTGRRES